MAWLFGGLGLPGPVVRLVAAWKEGLIAALVAAALLRRMLGGGHRSPILWLDVAIFGLGLVALAYLLGAGVWFGLDVPVAAQLYGLRDAVYFSLLYFVGRRPRKSCATSGSSGRCSSSASSRLWW